MKTRKLKKKFKISGFVALLTSVFMFITFASASSQTKIKLSTSNTDVKRGDTVVVDVDLENEKEYSGIGFTFDYDTDVLEYVTSSVKVFSNNVEDGTDENYYFTQVLNNNGQAWTLAYLDPDAFLKVSRKLGTITFKVKSDAKAGETTINLKNIEAYKVETVHVDEETDESVTTEISTEVIPVKLKVNVPVTSHSLASENIELDVASKKTDNIVVNYAPLDTTDSKEFTYKSNDESIVTVDASGKVTAVNPGSTTIDVKAFNTNYVVNVKVTSHITSISLDKTSIELSKGESETLKATLNPTNTSDDKTITWESSNTDAVTVNSNGLVTAVGGGEATITAKSSVDGIVDTCNVKVVVPFTSVTLEKDEFTLERGVSGKDTATLKVNYAPADATQSKTVTWKSNDESIAAVDTNGKITAVSSGSTIITGKVGKFTLTANVTVKVPITEFSVDTSSVELYPTQSKQLNTTITPSDTNESKIITWNSSNTSVATVSDGKITAVGSGNATITGTLENGKKVTVNVKVLKPIENFTISQSEIILYKNDSNKNSEKLSVTITPADADEDKTVTWESKNTKIVTVDSNGLITAVGSGETTIVGTLKNGKKVECKVTVKINIDTFKLDSDSSVTLERNETYTAKTTISPSDTTESKIITWKSSDESVAKVDKNGVVTALSSGDTTITGTLENGKNVVFTVKVIIPIENIEINSNNVSLNRGNSKQLTATVNPEDTTESKTITWSSSDKKVVTVDSNGLITAVGSGEAAITAKVGSKTDSIKVTVNVPITSFEVSSEEETIIKGQSKTLNTTILPSDTTDNKTIIWKSSNEKIATVDSNGVVKGVSAGNATITGTLKNGMKVETEVTVKIIPVESIKINEEELDIKKGESTSLTVTINPKNTTEDTTITWSSSDEGIATIDSNGVVKGISEGNVVITAKLGELTSTIDVNVEEIPLTSIEISNKDNKVEVDGELQLVVAPTPSDTTDELIFTYKSSDESIATVDSNGVVKGIKKGKVTITVTYADGIEDTIDLVINEPASKVSVASPNTGVTSIIVYIIIGLCSLVGIGLTLKKKLS